MMKQLLKNRFLEIYQKEPDKYFSCGGRFEVLGNHTDHNHGLCLAATCNLSIYAAVKKRNDLIVNVYSEGFGGFKLNLSSLEKLEKEKGQSSAFIRGICYYLTNIGLNYGGFDMYCKSEVPPGAGVSSSAAFELLIATTIKNLFNKEDACDLTTLCKAGQFAEVNYYGKVCGLLDQIGVAYGGLVYIDFSDIVNPNIKHIDANLDGYQFVIVNSGGSHAGLDHFYAEIPQDMKSVAKYFGKEVLRDVEKDLVIKNKDDVIAKCGLRAYKRAMHFYSENERVTTAYNLAASRQWDKIIELINESRKSSTDFLKNMCVDDQIAGSPLEACELVMEASHNRAGVKINGGGFAGSVIALVPNNELDNVVKAAKEKYGNNNVHLVSIRNQTPSEL